MSQQILAGVYDSVTTPESLSNFILIERPSVPGRVFHNLIWSMKGGLVCPLPSVISVQSRTSPGDIQQTALWHMPLQASSAEALAIGPRAVSVTR